VGASGAERTTKPILALLASTALVSTASAQQISYQGQGVRVGPSATAPNSRATFTSGSGPPPSLTPDDESWGVGSIYSNTGSHG
jgi:hypothetical protein